MKSNLKIPYLDGVAQNRKAAAREMTRKFLLSDELRSNSSTEKCVRINPLSSDFGYDVSKVKSVERDSRSIEIGGEKKRRKEWRLVRIDCREKRRKEEAKREEER